MTVTAEQLVRREVHYCVSALVSTLACSGYDGKARDMNELCDQAYELSMPIDDWEEAAVQEGWSRGHVGEVKFPMWGKDGAGESFESAQDLCEEHDIEPYQREVFEHWIVSDWLADKLIEHGEKVDKDFAGLTVWARTTTGQGIASDSVIEAIVAELNR